MVLHRMERDFMKGTATATREKKRRYHMKVSCVELRHEKFDPKVLGTIEVDEQWYTTASVDERELAELFMNREV